MRDESILSTQKLKIALYDFGTRFDRSALKQCGNAFPAVELAEEAELKRILRKQGLEPKDLLRWGENFESFQTIRDFHLLLITFVENRRVYLRAINYFGKYVSTVMLDVKRPTCAHILRGQRFMVVDSSPPIADVKVDDRFIGEAPVWTWLKDGQYVVNCALPGQIFNPLSVKIPIDVHVLCRRENISSSSVPNTEEKASMEEKAGSVLVYIVGGAAALAAIVLPILLLF